MWIYHYSQQRLKQYTVPKGRTMFTDFILISHYIETVSLQDRLADYLTCMIQVDES